MRAWVVYHLSPPLIIREVTYRTLIYFGRILGAMLAWVTSSGISLLA